MELSGLRTENGRLKRALIPAIHAELKGAYGSPCRGRERRARGSSARQERVERRMREKSLPARHQRRTKVTTDAKHSLPVAANRLDRNFTPAAPNKVWTSDITSLWIDEGGLTLAIILDGFTREVVGGSLKPRMTTDIVTDARTLAWFRQRPAPGLMHHADRGSPYASQCLSGQAQGIR